MRNSCQNIEVTEVVVTIPSTLAGTASVRDTISSPSILKLENPGIQQLLPTSEKNRGNLPLIGLGQSQASQVLRRVESLLSTRVMERINWFTTISTGKEFRFKTH